MQSTSVPLLVIAAATVGFLHSILPDHWVPLAVVARAQRWTLLHTARISLLASVGHVLTSIVLGGIIALVGLQFRKTFETQQAHIVGVVLVLTGIGFALWSLTGHGGHSHEGHPPDHGVEDDHGDGEHADNGSRPHVQGHEHAYEDDQGSSPDQSKARGIAGILVPFGAAASPDLTILPIFLAASAVGLGAVVGVLTAFSFVTLATFVGLTVAATIAGYQVKGEWLEQHGNTVTAGVLIIIGMAVYVNLF